MHVLVTGATGAVGPMVVRALVAAGMTVRVLVRSMPAPGLLPDGVTAVQGDITVPETVHAAMAGCEAVVHLAALLHINDPSPALAATYELVNVRGTEHLLAAAHCHGVQRFVFMSTIAIYGKGTQDPTTPPFTELSRPHPDSFYSRTKLQAEEAVLAATQPNGQPLGVVLRPAAIYGVRIKGNYERLFTALAKGRFLPVGSGANRRTLVYDHDLARAVVLALTHPAAAGRVYNVTDGTHHTLHQIITAICNALGRPAPYLSLPLAPVKLAVGLCEDSLRLLGRATPLNRAMLDKYCEEIVVDGSRLAAELGFRPQTTLEMGWQHIAANRTCQQAKPLNVSAK